jgi:exonuclease III
MKKFLIISLLFFFLSHLAISQETIKVMSYNLLNFGNYTGFCSSSNNPHSTKAIYLKTIIKDQEPDILAVCELSSNIYYMNYILGNSLNVDGTTKWEKIDFTNKANSQIINGLFYDKTKFSFNTKDSIKAIETGVRDINIYKLKCLNAPNDVYLHVIIAHLKAGNTNSDKLKRAEMTEKIMEWLNQYPENQDNFIIVGDFNVYTYTETAFQNLINPSNFSISFYDPTKQVGNWHDNNTYSSYHTQSTHTESNGCAATGGFDDRFDFILVNSSIIEGNKNIKYKENSYIAVGQDGNRMKESLINPENTSLPTDVITALYNMSDHLPIVAEFYVGEQINTTSISTDSKFNVHITTPTASTITYEIRIPNTQKLNVNIYTPIGEKVFHEQIIAKSGEIYNHNIRQLPVGMYILSFEGEGIKKSYKIIKTN